MDTSAVAEALAPPLALVECPNHDEQFVGGSLNTSRQLGDGITEGCRLGLASQSSRVVKDLGVLEGVSVGHGTIINPCFSAS